MDTRINPSKCHAKIVMQRNNCIMILKTLVELHPTLSTELWRPPVLSNTQLMDFFGPIWLDRIA
uniref:Uncharacterized protein n=1 Tax=Cucumis melo TaxID=3656 RepID=A0A9I9EIS3_CUCME